ncbi:MAG: FG-GAP repeat domain-containing protein [Myxococcota bacterium]
MRHILLALLVLPIAFTGCAPDDNGSDPTPDTGMTGDADTDPSQTDLTGSVQKGPFVTGSSVNVSATDNSGNPTGQVFSTQTNNDLGEFELAVGYAGLASLEASGFYYNEVTGGLSGAELVLRAYADIRPGGAQSTYINILTHLASGRVATLLEAGNEYAAAQQQAMTELVGVLDLGPPSIAPNNPNQLNLLGGDTDPNAYLFAVSTVFAQAAMLRSESAGGSVEANLQELLNQFSQDFADDGEVASDRASELESAERAIDTDMVEALLRDRLDQLGSTADVPDLDRIIDTDDDGQVNANDNCVLDPAPQPQDVVCDVSTRSLVALETRRSPLLWWAADFDQNGDGEILTVEVSATGAALRYIDEDANGDFVLGDRQAIAVQQGENVESPALLDFDDDGDLDIIAVLTGREDPSDLGALVFENDGSGQFSMRLLGVPTTTWPDGINLERIDEFTMIDVSGDGERDIILRQSDRIGVLLAQSGDTWSDVTELDLGDTAFESLSGMTTTDVDGDGDVDVVIGAATRTTDVIESGVVALVNDNDGEPAVMGPYFGLDESVVVSQMLHPGDYDADGQVDVLISSTQFPCEGTCVGLAYGDSTGAFSTFEQLPIRPTGRDVDTGDFNSDGVTDVVLAGNETELLIGADSGFQTDLAVDLATFNRPVSSRVVDLDGDGRSDIVSIEDPGSDQPYELRGWYFEGPTNSP